METHFNSAEAAEGKAVNAPTKIHQVRGAKTSSQASIMWRTFGKHKWLPFPTGDSRNDISQVPCITKPLSPGQTCISGVRRNEVPRNAGDAQGASGAWHCRRGMMNSSNDWPASCFFNIQYVGVPSSNTTQKRAQASNPLHKHHEI